MSSRRAIERQRDDRRGVAVAVESVPVPAPPSRFEAFDLGAVDLARRLLGQRLVRVEPDGTRCAGIIVETEAYVGPRDRAAHSFGGRRTARTATMYLGGGHAYVYFVYGMHWCLNVVAGPLDSGQAVLLRAIRPTEGQARMGDRRKVATERLLCAGPARLAAALAIDGAFDGENLRFSRTLFIERLPRARGAKVVTCRRVGVEYAGPWADRPWRFLLAGEERWWSRGPERVSRAPRRAKRS